MEIRLLQRNAMNSRQRIRDRVAIIRELQAVKMRMGARICPFAEVEQQAFRFLQVLEKFLDIRRDDIADLRLCSRHTCPSRLLYVADEPAIISDDSGIAEKRYTL